MVIKDTYCIKCNTVQELYCDRDEETMQADCATCGKQRTHRSACSGGMGRRWRCNDTGFDPTGYIQSGGVACGRPHPEAVGTPEEASSATPDRMHRDDSITHEQERFSQRVRDDRRAERRDKQRNADGRAPQYYNT